MMLSVLITSSSSLRRTSTDIGQSVMRAASVILALSWMLVACLYPNGDTLLLRLPGVVSFQFNTPIIRRHRRPQQQFQVVRRQSQSQSQSKSQQAYQSLDNRRIHKMQLSSNLDDFNEMYNAAEDAEAAQEQAARCLQALSEYHVGEWTGQATSFTVSPDIAAGILRRKTSPPYTLAVQITNKTNPANSAFTETLTWQEEDGSESSSARSIPLFTSQSNMDVDDADASYSFDRAHDHDMTVGLPTMLLGTNKECAFAVEHVIAAGENERCRCIVMYGTDEALLRIVIINEHRVVTETKKQEPEQDIMNILTPQDREELKTDVDRFVDKISANMQTTPPPQTDAPKFGPRSPIMFSDKYDAQTKSVIDVVNYDTIDDDDDTDQTVVNTLKNVNISGSSPAATNRLEELGKRMQQADDTVSTTEDSAGGQQELVPYRMTLLQLSAGIWLGDAIIRDKTAVPVAPPSPTTTTRIQGKNKPTKGFGTSSSPPDKQDDNDEIAISSTSSNNGPTLFTGWELGVQKLTWEVLWNFSDEIRQYYNAGKAFGGRSLLHESLTQPLIGSVCLDETVARRVPPPDRMTYLDWPFPYDQVTVMVGPYLVQVPRSSTMTRPNRPFATEFCVFQSSTPPTRSVSSTASDDNTENEEPELCCSKISRVYNYKGQLKQGVTSFFTLKRFAMDDDYEDDTL